MGINSKAKNTSRIVAVGLDSADFDLIQKWVNEGHLRVIASLMSRGSWGKLNSTSDIGSGTVWPSFFTGTSPAKHGRLQQRRLKPGTYRIVDKPNANQIRKQPFWFQLSKAGRRIAVIDVPVTYPGYGLNGIQLVDWGAHGSSWHPDSWPPEVVKAVNSRFGQYPHGCLDIVSGYDDLDRMRKFYRELITGVEKKGLVSRYFLDQEDWDLFITVFAEPHCAGHNLWHLMDKNDTVYDSELTKNFSNSIFNVYSSLDSEIGKLGIQDGDITFLIFSLEGMGPNHTGSHLLPEVLRRLGMSGYYHETKSDRTSLRCLESPVKKLLRLTPASLWGPSAVRNIRDALPRTVLNTVERFKKIVPREKWNAWKSYLLTTGNDWRWSRAFCVPSDFHGAIRINRRGREPAGLVEPGAEYESLCNELIQELSQLKNIDTGEKAISEVFRVDQIYEGEYIDELPDLIVKWAGEAPINGLYSQRIGTITGENRHDRVGAHTPYGFLIAYGKHINKGKIHEGANIMDIAPTILYLMYQPIPRDMDGKVLLDLIDEEFRLKNPVRYI